ncbi:MAG: response regulator [Actinobacteria bacterium]|nr:response regulator [Actinomycetota bacterium]
MGIDLGRLRAIFREELDERRQTLEQGLLELERSPSVQRRTELLRELFRAAHSLKGAALSVGSPAVAAVAHQLEETLEGLQGTDETEIEVAALLDEVDRLGRAADDDASAEPSRTGPGTEAEPGPTLSGDTGTGRSPPARADRPPPSDGASSGRARVPVGELEAALTSAGQLQLAIHSVEDLADGTAACASVVRRVHADLQHLTGVLVARDRPGGRPPNGRAVADELAQQLVELERRLGHLGHRTDEVQRELVRSGADVSRAVQVLSMVEFDQVCAGLDRAVRDVAEGSGKRVRLQLASGALELDRTVAAALRDPLLHLVRNAVDHGIEPPAVRERDGKPPVGRIRVAAEVRSGRLVVEVSDDGTGIDPVRVREAAERAGLEPPSDPAELLQLVFAPGLSTSRDVTDVSGRGVGLDAVRSDVEAVGGTAEIASDAGRGTTVTLALPLSLSTMRVLVVKIGSETVALPATAVRNVLRVDREDLVHMGARRGVLHDDRSVPIVDLASVLGFTGASARDDDGSVVVVVDVPGGHAGLSVDGPLEQHEVTVRTLGPRLEDAPGVLGAVTLPDGNLVLVLNPATWARRAMENPVPSAQQAGTETSRAPHVLLAEDTLTTRTLERSILEAAGYVVTAAADGAEAWELLQQRGADLVITDVDMPNMDGFSLCEAIRSSPRFSDVPVVLVTSLSDDRHRARGAEVGANAYFVKSDFDQRTLLDTVARLL